MRIPDWVLKVLSYCPFIKITESKPLNIVEAQLMIRRILQERQTQWSFEHPGVPFPGVDSKEVIAEFQRRCWAMDERDDA